MKIVEEGKRLMMFRWALAVREKAVCKSWGTVRETTRIKQRVDEIWDSFVGDKKVLRGKAKRVREA